MQLQYLDHLAGCYSFVWLSLKLIVRQLIYYNNKRHLQVTFFFSCLLWFYFYEEIEKDIKLEMDWEKDEVKIFKNNSHGVVNPEQN